MEKKEDPIIVLLKKLAVKLERNVAAYYLANGNIFRDPKKLLIGLQEKINTEIKGWQANMGLKTFEAACKVYESFGMASNPTAQPTYICGETATMLCHVFHDTEGFSYAHETAFKITDPKKVSSLLSKYLDQGSFMIRVTFKTHSYSIYCSKEDKRSYLLQSNRADCLKYFSFREWMQSPNLDKEFDVLEHIKILKNIEKDAVIAPKTELAKAIASTFTIGKETDVSESIKFTNFKIEIYLIHPESVAENINLLLAIKE